MTEAASDRAIVAEFHKDSGGRLTLFAMTILARDDGDAYVSRKQYDVDHSRKYGYLFDQTGFGGDDVVQVTGIYFVSGDVKIREKPTQLVDGNDRPPWRGKKTKAIRARNKTRRLHKLPKAFNIEPGQDLLDWMHRNAIEQDGVYCSECRDWVLGDELCKHCWWCDKTCWYSTPTERCKCKDRDECHD